MSSISVLLSGNVFRMIGVCLPNYFFSASVGPHSARTTPHRRKSGAHCVNLWLGVRFVSNFVQLVAYSDAIGGPLEGDVLGTANREGSATLVWHHAKSCATRDLPGSWLNTAF